MYYSTKQLPSKDDMKQSFKQTPIFLFDKGSSATPYLVLEQLKTHNNLIVAYTKPQSGFGDRLSKT